MNAIDGPDLSGKDYSKGNGDMKVSVPQKELADAIAIAKKGISHRATLPVLSAFKVDANGRLTIQGTDLETVIRASVDVKADADGTAIIPSKMFEQTVKGMKGQTVTLDAGEGEISIRGDLGGVYRLKTLSLEDYPATAPQAGADILLDAGELARALARVIPSASGDESRQVLTGISLEIAQGTLTLAATDGYRLAVATVAYVGAEGFTAKGVAPAGPLKELAKVAKKAGAGESVSFTCDPDHRAELDGTYGTFQVGALEIGCRFICGQFPNWRQIIPAGYQNVATLPNEVTQSVLSRVGLYAQNNLPVKLTFGATWEGTKSTVLEISAHTPDVGEASETVGTPYQGDPLVIAFNPGFLAEGLKCCGSEQVTFEAGDGLKPAILRPADEEGFTYLLMPVRLS